LPARTVFAVTPVMQDEKDMSTDPALLQVVADSSPDVIEVFRAIRDNEGRVVDFVWLLNNKRAIEKNGDNAGKSLLKKHPEVLTSGILSRMIQVTETGEPHQPGNFYSPEPIKDKWFYHTILPLKDGCVLISRDARVDSNADLRRKPAKRNDAAPKGRHKEQTQKSAGATAENSDWWRVTMESAEDFSIVTLTKQGVIEGWSKGAENMFGYSEAEAVGKFTDIFFTEEDRERNIPNKEIEAALRDGIAMDERWHRRKDGSRLYVSGVMRPIYNPSLAGFVKVGRDMTEQKLLQQQKDEFIGIASHELKTPVTSIKVLTEFLHEQFVEENNFSAANLMAKLSVQVNRLGQLIKDLLDTTRIADGKLALNFEEILLNDFIANHIEELRRLSPSHEFRFELNAEGAVMADKERLEQVLTNFVSNAFKYSAPGTIITVRTEDHGADVKVSVADQGIGIPGEVQSKVFDRYFRVSGEKMQTYPGMGLGLYISAGIIRRHGGHIFVESTEGHGSVFSFVLPRTNVSQ
jgi:PAS domain S-box-containing protein